MQKTIKKYNANSSFHKHELSPDRSSVRPTDHPSNRESVRPTVRPVLLRRKTNVVLSATTSTLFMARPTAATFVVAMNRVDVVALNTIFALRLSKTGRTVGRTDSRLDGWSVGRTNERFVGQVNLSKRQTPFIRFDFKPPSLDPKTNGQPPRA